jgi:hypothetical protein
LKDASIELGVQAHDFDKYTLHCKKAHSLARFGDGLMVESKKSCASKKEIQDVIEEEECMAMTRARVSVRFPVGKFLPPANSLLPKVLLYPSKPGLELLKGRLEFDGDGQSSLSARLELQAIKEVADNFKG